MNKKNVFYSFNNKIMNLKLNNNLDKYLLYRHRIYLKHLMILKMLVKNLFHLRKSYFNYLFLVLVWL